MKKQVTNLDYEVNKQAQNFVNDYSKLNHLISYKVKKIGIYYYLELFALLDGQSYKNILLQYDEKSKDFAFAYVCNNLAYEHMTIKANKLTKQLSKIFGKDNATFEVSYNDSLKCFQFTIKTSKQVITLNYDNDKEKFNHYSIS